MKIAYILAEKIDINGTSGASAHVRENIKYFRKAGHEVFLITNSLVNNSQNHSEISQSNEARDILIKKTISSTIPNFIKIFLRNWRTQKNAQKLLIQNQEILQQCDIVYERDAFCNLKIYKYCQKHKIPYVIECNGFFWGNLASNFHKPIFPVLYKKQHIHKWRQADHLIAVSSKFRDNMISEGISPDKISVIHNGVNIDLHKSVSTEEVTQLKDNIKLENQVVIGFLGHMLPWHRIDILLTAIKELNNANYPVKGLIVGGGRWEEYRQQACTIGIEEKVVFTGPVKAEKVPLMVACMDVCTLPGSNDYGSPVKLFDYGAAKRAVIAANFPAVKEIIEDKYNGVLFRRDSVTDFVEKLKNLINSQELREKLGNNLFQTIESNHTWQKVAERTLSIFEQVITHK